MKRNYIENNKFIITFGSSQLDEFYVRPNDVALIIEAENENEARNQVCNFKGIAERFCTSYQYEKYIDEFVNKYNMKEYTLEDLEKLRIKGKQNMPDNIRDLEINVSYNSNRDKMVSINGEYFNKDKAFDFAMMLLIASSEILESLDRDIKYNLKGK